MNLVHITVIVCFHWKVIISGCFNIFLWCYHCGSVGFFNPEQFKWKKRWTSKKALQYTLLKLLLILHHNITLQHFWNLCYFIEFLVSYSGMPCCKTTLLISFQALMSSCLSNFMNMRHERIAPVHCGSKGQKRELNSVALKRCEIVI